MNFAFCLSTLLVEELQAMDCAPPSSQQDNQLCLLYPACVWTATAARQHEVRSLLQLLLLTD